MKIGIIGAGKMGCAFSIGLKNKGFNISAIFSKSKESAHFLNNKLQLKFIDSIKGVLKKADVIFITVPDQAISNVVDKLVLDDKSLDIKDKTFFHASGALTSDVLKALKAKGAYTASFHPIQTFADKINGYKGLEGAYYGFEGCINAKKVAQDIVKSFNGTMIEIKKEDKSLYHAAACIISNYTATLSYMAGEIFEKIGIDRNVGEKALMPLFQKTVDNIKEYDSIQAITGPIQRADYSTIEGHLKELDDKFIDAYKVLGDIASDIAIEKGNIDYKQYSKLKQLFKKHI